MIRLRYKNTNGTLVSPMLHNQIVTGYSLTPDYLIVICQRTIMNGTKPTDFKWNLTPPVADIQNLPEVLAWLTENKYEHVVVDKKSGNAIKEISKKAKKEKPTDQPKLEF